MRGTAEKAGQLSLQGGKLRLVKALLGKAPGNGAVQHVAKAPEGAPPLEPLPQAKGCARSRQGQQHPAEPGHCPTSQV